MASLLSSLRRTAPKLPISSDFFICQRCLRHSPSLLSKVKVPGKANLSRSIRFNSSTTFAASKSPLSHLSQTIVQNAEKEAAGKKKSAWPETSSNAVGYWLLASAGSVFGIVVFGGLTRLTESGYAYMIPYSPLLSLRFPFLHSNYFFYTNPPTNSIPIVSV